MVTYNKSNMFSQITDKAFYADQPVMTWKLTDNMTMTNSSQSYTTTTTYRGNIDVQSTRYGQNGVSYYTLESYVDGNVTASIHPLEYTSTSSISNIQVVEKTTETNSYSVAVENNANFNYVESTTTTMPGGGNTTCGSIFMYSAGRVVDTVGITVFPAITKMCPDNATMSFGMSVSVSNYYSYDGTRNNLKQSVYKESDINNGKIDINLLDGGVSLLGPPTIWYCTVIPFIEITYKSYEDYTTSTSTMLTSKTDSFSSYNTGYLVTFSSSNNFYYLSYYSKSSSWNTLTTNNKTYSVTTNTTSSYVEPRQLSNLF